MVVAIAFISPVEILAASSSLAPSVTVKPHYLPLEFISGADEEIELQINRKSLELDLNKTQNIRVRLKVKKLYKQVNERISSFKINLYEIVGSEKKFVSSQNLTIRKGYDKGRVLSIGAGYFAAPTKMVEFEIYDTANNLVNTYSTQLTAYNLESQVLGGEGLDLEDADCDNSKFGDCQLDYLFKKITFEAKPQRQISTRILKGEDGLYKVTIPVPRSQFKFLGKSVKRRNGVSLDGQGTTLGFGETISVTTVQVGTGSDNYGTITSAPQGNIKINNQLCVDPDGKLGIGLCDPTARLDINGGTATVPQIKLRPGTLTTSPQDGALEFDGSKLYFTKNGVRSELGAKGDTGATGATGPQGPAGSGGSGSVTAPTLSSSSPADDSTGLATSANLVLNFNTVVAEGNGTITLYRADNSVIETIDSNNASKVTFSGNRITINPSTTLDYSTGYYVLIDNTAITSGLDTSTAWGGISSATTLNFTTTSPPGLAVSSLNPADNAVNVSRSGTFAITFNVPVTRNSGNVTFRKSSDNSIFDQFTIGSGQVTLSNANQTVTFDPAGNLAYSNGYYIQVDANAIENSYTPGDYFAGYSSSSSWNFTVQGPSNLSLDENFSLPANGTSYASTTNVANMQSSDTPVTTVTMTNNKVAGDSTVVVAFNTATNLPSTITLVGGTVITFGVDAVVPDSYANRYTVPTQEYSFYVNTTTHKLMISNEPSAFGVYTTRTITATFINY